MNIPEFSQAELDSRIAIAHSEYEFNLPEFGTLTALEKFMPDSIAHSLELYAEKRKAGYTPSEVQPMIYGTVTPWIEFHLYKPQKTQDKERAVIAADVEAAYRAEIDAQLKQLIEIEAARSVERKKREQEAARIAREEAELAEARREVMAALGLQETE
ncbi:hypothetical protein ID144_23720 [Pseudomonas sp. JM0905a]|uniref:hypothetical protein n=1 Tax=Pseudomonas sp. JM0905a TaxID=2772484 RepID=UPI001683B84D|nr:hypothetical protein [Pseudomonas sp. JM0905a]MBD2840056.1 hypothetical protein [Pseudomonas sp. JM0905a]